MYYFRTKVVLFLLSPWLWSCLLLVIAILYNRYRKKLIILATFILLFFSNKFLYQVSVRGWENQFQSTTNQSKYYGVTLGGMAHWDCYNKCICFNNASERYETIVDLYNNKTIEKIVFSGGGPKSVKSEAQALKEYAEEQGIADSCVFAEGKSLNTHENARFTAQLFDQYNFNKDIILVTSAFHMARAKASFEKEGFSVVPVATHRIQLEPLNQTSDYLLPDINVMKQWKLILKEWLGIAVYKVLGYC